MNRRFRLQLTIILIVFSLCISIVIAVFDFGKLEERVRIGHATKIAMAEDKIIDSLTTIDKVYNLLDYQIADEMKRHSDTMLDMYEQEPDFEKWDFQGLKEQFEMDVFVINEENTVINSSLAADIGLNFNKCCDGLAKLLRERRESGIFSHDGMDLQQSNGEIRKFSYMPTPDRKYILELSVPLENKAIFQQFDLMTTINKLEKEYDAISSIRVYNSAGHLLDFRKDRASVQKLPPDLKEVLRNSMRSGEPQEIVGKVEGQHIIHRYIPYSADEKRGLSTSRAVEIIYNDSELAGLLGVYRNGFIFQLMGIVSAAVALSFVIARLVAKPIHLAFHDSLTGLKNRAAFEEEIKKRFMRKNNRIALMMIDLDNFKIVNDSLGHMEGDRILQLAAKTIQEIAGPKNIAARLGGDEFVVIFSEKEESKVLEVASEMIEKIKTEFSSLQEHDHIKASISIGIAYATADDDMVTLYDKADQALYQSKENGKNQYNVYGMEKVFS
ncbi:GGDEF domain-containing protein [Sporosarcina sp. FSL K6-1522]|uniref:GGDEF domain-containing protein n=1 Tax=Sporosarcina sp. FSL K6-1522 TaxID=2921554 RepID=UPI00315B25B8